MNDSKLAKLTFQQHDNARKSAKRSMAYVERLPQDLALAQYG
jgi:hypothetical protein